MQCNIYVFLQNKKLCKLEAICFLFVSVPPYVVFISKLKIKRLQWFQSGDYRVIWFPHIYFHQTEAIFWKLYWVCLYLIWSVWCTKKTANQEVYAQNLESSKSIRGFMMYMQYCYNLIRPAISKTSCEYFFWFPVKTGLAQFCLIPKSPSIKKLKIF